MNIGIITARGGSKGLPRKNTLELKGLPLIVWTIKAAQHASSLDSIFVTTEDAEISEISRHYGAKVIERPLELAQDSTSSEPVIQHAINYLKVKGLHVQNICLLQPTSPLRTACHIDDAFEKFGVSNTNCVLSVFEPSYSAAKAYKLNNDGSLTGLLFEDAPYTSRQALPVTYQPNGAIYWFSADRFIEDGKLPRTGVYPYVMSKSESIDIDTIEDFHKAEELLNLNYDKNQPCF